VNSFFAASPALQRTPVDRTALLRRIVYVLFILLIANLGAIMDYGLHPSIPYFDVEHIVVGGVNALAVAGLFVVLEIYLLKRRKMEAAVRESGQKFQALFENMLAGVAIAAQNDVLVANKAMLEIFGYTAEEFSRVPLIESIAPESRPLFQERMSRVERGEPVPPYCEYSIRRKDGTSRVVHAMSARVSGEGRVCRQLVFIDITERKRTEEALLEAHARLTTAGDNIKVLRGLLPICCGCKRIRDDKKYWHQVDQYIAEHSEATFTHGFCPECAQKYYPDLDHSLHLS
jgi:PAS domain S-box-containing protein